MGETSATPSTTPMLSSRRTPGPIGRDLSLGTCGDDLFYQLRTVIMGPGVRRDDGGEGASA